MQARRPAPSRSNWGAKEQVALCYAALHPQPLEGIFMFRIALFAIAASLIAITINAGVAQAQPTRVFVAAQGLDTNPCTFALPCRTFQHAHNVAAAGGEIDVLDPAGYGSVIITKSISIQGHGFSGISVTGGGTAISINAGASDAINLSGLIIEGAGVGATGIAFATGGGLTIENCVIRHLTGRGIDFHPNGDSNLTVSETLVADNGGRGIMVAPSAGAVNAVFNRVEVYKNAVAGITLSRSSGSGSLNETLGGTVTDSVAAHNGGHGFGALSAVGATGAQLSIVRSTATHNPVGVEAGSLSAISLAQSMLSFNRTAAAVSGTGAVGITFGDNYYIFNDLDGPALNPIGKQ